MLLHLATSCFPNCHPPAGSGWTTDSFSGTGIGALAVLGAFYLLLSRKGKGSK